MIELKGKYTTAKVMIDEVEPKTQSQLMTMLNHPSFVNPVAVMPDTHYGAGVVIGFTMEMADTIIPNIVGVDINCGMLSFMVKDDFDSPELHKGLCLVVDQNIRKWIPFGTNVHNDSTLKYKIDKFPWKKVTEQGRLFTMAFNKKYNANYDVPVYGKNWFRKKCEQIGMDMRRAIRSIGTLGSGNHFIEIGRDQNNNVWITIHSGSRQFGQKIALYWQKVASDKLICKNHDGMLKEVERIKKDCPKESWQDEIMDAKKKYKFVPKGLEYLEGEDMFGYLIDMVFAQAYADENRKTMKDILLDAAQFEQIGAEISCSHNYINFNDFIIRKGAISARAGENMIIPFNMEEGTLICQGKGNAEWNYSAPHGAGRLMARGDAKRKAKKYGFVEKAKERMEKAGIFASRLPADELKEAYKDSKIIENAIEPTATITHRIKPIIAMKDKN
jgi:tRNA-splicing ligase RtcB (3'-phosphate/5'-hydroxy nucleic acid ligase)